MKKIGAFWLKESESAGRFMSGRLDTPCPMLIGSDVSLMLFRNKNKEEGDNKPDYELFAAEPKAKSNRAAVSSESSLDSDAPF